MKIAWLLFVQVLKRRMAYRGDLLLAMLDELLRGLLALTLLEVYASKSQHLAGWTHAELLFVLGFSLVPVALFHTFCGNLYQLSAHYIIGGNFDRVLLRPYPTFLQVCLDRIAIEDLSGAVLGLVVMVLAAQQMPGFDTSPLGLLLIVVMLLSATGVVTAIFMAFAATGFWFEDRVGMVPPVYNLMEFGRWPASIYHPWLKLLITCVIPFSFVAFLPAGALLGKADASLGWWTPVIATLALAIAHLLWRTGVRRYNSAGS